MFVKRIVTVVAIGYIIGILWGLYCNCNIAFMYVAIFGIYLIAKLIFSYQKEFKLFSIKRYSRYLKLVLKFNVIITIIISSLISNIITLKLNNKYETLYSKIIEDIEIVATIVSNKQEKEYFDVYKIKVETVNNSNKFKNTYLILRMKKNVDTKIEYGDTVKIKGKFIEASAQRNYGGFDYKQYLKTQKIYGIIEASNVINVIIPVTITLNNIDVLGFDNLLSSSLKVL